MYTHDNWKRLKKELSLKNKDIAEAIGLTIDSVKNQTQTSKELPSWARAMIFIHESQKTELDIKLHEFAEKHLNKKA